MAEPSSRCCSLTRPAPVCLASLVCQWLRAALVPDDLTSIRTWVTFAQALVSHKVTFMGLG